MAPGFPKSIEGKVAFVFGLGCLTVFALCLAFYLTIQEIRNSQRHIAQTGEMLLLLGSVVTKVTEAETGQRGYILTGEDRFLAPYQLAKRVLDDELQQLEKLTTGNAQQAEALLRLKDLVRQRLDRVFTAIELRRTNSFASALAYVQTGAGSELMEQIRTIAAEMAREERAVLERRYQKIERQSWQILFVFSLIAIGNVVLLVSIYLVVRQEVARRRATQEKQARLLKELERANRDLKDFAHIVSHDLKAPLRGIANLVSFLTQDYGPRLEAEGREQLRLLGIRVHRLHALVEGILNYSKAGRLSEPKEKVNLFQMVQEIVGLIAPPDNIKVTIDPNLPLVLVEPTKIFQVFQNLIGNAVKFQNKAEGKVAVGCRSENDQWVFHVSDNGSGIDQRHYQKIFEVFQTLASRDEMENTGIGLAVVKRLVEQWDGKIWLESTPGEGTTFFFSLPRN